MQNLRHPNPILDDARPSDPEEHLLISRETESFSIPLLTKLSETDLHQNDGQQIGNPVVKQQQPAKAEPHKLWYGGAAVIVLIFYFLFIFYCRWRKNNKNKKKPIQDQLVQQKVEQETAPQNSKKSKQVQMVELA